MSDCVIWNGANNGRYGTRWFNGRQMLAHRAAWEQEHGPIPAGMLVCHTCDVPLCVNPDHLFLGTQSDNMRDASAKGRLAQNKVTHCPRGHAYDEANTYWKHNSKGHRMRTCRACALETWHERKIERKQVVDRSVPIVCPACGDEFLPQNRLGRLPTYCSAECRNRTHNSARWARIRSEG